MKMHWKGISPPLLTAHQFIIDQKLNFKPENIDINQLLVKFSILEGELNKVYLDPTDPKVLMEKKLQV